MKLVLALLLAAASAFAQVRLPAYTKAVLPNGATILLLPRPGIPLVHFRVLIKGGVESDPQQMAGLASITAAMLRRGTGKRSATQFAEELEFLGGTFNSAFDTPLGSATAISSEFLKKDFDQGLDILADAILHPAFSETEVRKNLAQAVDAVKATKDNPQASITNYFRAAFYGQNHPYGNPMDGQSLTRISRKDIVDYHAKLYCGKNITVVVAGDFDLATAKTKLAEAFGQTPAGTPYVWRTVQPGTPKGRMVLVNKADATQTYFQIGQPGVDKKSPDRTTLEVVNTLFGGRFTSMLNEELRTNSGLTYGANSQLSQERLPGAITISTYTKTDTTVAAIDLALEVLKRFNEKGVTATQLASAKAFVKGQYPTRHLETIDQLATLIGNIELYELGRDEVDGYFARIDGVTLERANAAIRKYYQRENLTFVILGAADKIRDAVNKYDAKPMELSTKDAGWQ